MLALSILRTSSADVPLRFGNSVRSLASDKTLKHKIQNSNFHHIYNMKNIANTYNYIIIGQLQNLTWTCP